MRSNAVPRSASAPLEDSTGASHIVEGGVRVEMVKIESAPIFKVGSSSKTRSSARSCRCRAVSVDRSIAVSRALCLYNGHFVANLTSRKSPKNLKPDRASALAGRGPAILLLRAA